MPILILQPAGHYRLILIWAPDESPSSNDWFDSNRLTWIPLSCSDTVGFPPTLSSDGPVTAVYLIRAEFDTLGSNMSDGVSLNEGGKK